MFQKIMSFVFEMYSLVIFYFILWGKLEKQKIKLKPTKRVKYYSLQKTIGDFSILVPIMEYEKLRFITPFKLHKTIEKDYEVIFENYVV